MPKTINSPRHKRLMTFLAEQRKRAGLTQVQVAQALGRHQPFVANIESGERRVDAIELLDIAEIVGFDPHDLVDELLSLPSARRRVNVTKARNKRRPATS
jgi:transcriptional regulator with XRE-family HTH domain